MIVFGTGPGLSDAKVNLFGFQPVEFIKILIVLFLAGYFAQRWEFLRVLKERRPELANVTRHIDIPRLEYILPVLLAVAVLLVFFFLQKDLGPALLISCVFLALYAVARNRALLAFSGLALMLAGFLGGYFLQYPTDCTPARRHVALAVGQPRTRRRTGRPRALGHVERWSLRQRDSGSAIPRSCPPPTRI